MPLTILLPMVIIGIAGIAALLHQLGLSKPARFDTEARAREAWIREFPDHTPDLVTLSPDQSAALIETPNGRGLVWAMGADTTARYLGGAKVSRVGTGLRIELQDVTAPRIHLRMNINDVPVWIGLLKTLT